MSEISSNHELILVIDFGGQYNQLIARRVREHNIYCEVIPFTTSVNEIRKRKPKGIIFTGGPNSVYLENAPQVPSDIFTLGIPILGICYGAQLMVHSLGGKVGKANENAAAEFGRTECNFKDSCHIFSGLKNKSVVWMSHNDYIEKLPDDFYATAYSDKCPYAAIENPKKKFYGTQFHPEKSGSIGELILKNFIDKC